MKNSTCIYCCSTNHQKWINFKDIFDDEHQLDHCMSCGIYFLNPHPNQSQLERAYDESYYGFGEKKFNPIVEKVIDWFRRKNARAFAKRLPKNASVLDVGCGNGSFLYNLGKQGNFDLHGVELPGKSAERAAELKVINLHLGELTAESYPQNYFDAIVLTHVFEHLPNPKQVLEIIGQIAKPNAILQIEIPNIASWQAHFFKRHWLHLDPPRHLHFMSPNQLKLELTKLGFECRKESYFSPQFSPFGAQQSILNFMLPRREILYEYLKGNKEYVKEYSAFHLFCQKLFHWLSFPFFVLTDGIASSFSKGATVKLVFQKSDE